MPAPNKRNCYTTKKTTILQEKYILKIKNIIKNQIFVLQRYIYENITLCNRHERFGVMRGVCLQKV